MILKELTIKKFGYDPDLYSDTSGIKVVVLCPKCNRTRIISKANAARTKYCRPCSIKSQHEAHLYRRYATKRASVVESIEVTNRPKINKCCCCGQPATINEAWSNEIRHFCKKCVAAREKKKKEIDRRNELLKAGVL